jgi:Concanavalin A-like lectin/glucanases superfamily
MKTRSLTFTALLLIAAAASSFGQSLTLGLVAHYELDGNGLDSSGNAAHGTIINNVVPTTDRFGVPNAAMYFPANFDAINGTGINIANSSSSISLWVNKQYVGNLFNGSWILRVGNVGSTGQALHIALDYGSSIRYDFYNDTFDINTPIVPFDEWHHLAFTFNDTTNQRNIYVDGDLVATDTSAGDFIGNSTFEFGNVNMELDDIRFYNRVLSPTEVEMAYSVPEPSTAVFGLLSALVLAVRRNRSEPIA